MPRGFAWRWGNAIMKRLLTTAALGAALCLSVGVAVAEPLAQSYKAGRDFSYRNPGGVWSYGYGTTGVKASFTSLGALIDKCGGAEALTDCFRVNEGLVGSNVTGKTQVVNATSSSIVVPSAGLLLHPNASGQDVIVQFKAPQAGSYEMKGFYQILDNAPTSVAPKIFINAKDVTKKAFGSKADVVLSGAADPAAKKGGEKKSFSLTRTLAKGDRLQFGLNPNGDWRFDSTSFDVTITPVAE